MSGRMKFEGPAKAAIRQYEATVHEARHFKRENAGCTSPGHDGAAADLTYL